MRRLFEWLDRGRGRGRERGGLGGTVLISERELAEMFLHVPNSPGWKATLAVLDLEVQEGLDRCLEERLTNEQLRYRLGCVAGLLEFKEVLLERERDPPPSKHYGGQGRGIRMRQGRHPDHG